jgi:hypothetical protein
MTSDFGDVPRVTPTPYLQMRCEKNVKAKTVEKSFIAF